MFRKFIFRRYLQLHQPNYIHLYVQGRRQDFGWGGDIQQKFIKQRLLKIFEKFIKHLHKNLKNSSKFFKNKIQKNFRKF